MSYIVYAFVFVDLLFLLTTVLAIKFFLELTGRSVTALAIILGWLLLQAILALTGFYQVTDSVPPRFALALIPPVLVIVGYFLVPAGRNRVEQIDLRVLTILHVVRMPVECVLFVLFIHGQIPRIMTFEGGNWDILSGVSAPLVYYSCFVKGVFGKKILLIWNIVCLCLLVNIVIRAVLSAPFPFQRFGFEQPNRAILYFPFIFLPSFIVPLVLFSHLTAIRRLLRN